MMQTYQQTSRSTTQKQIDFAVLNQVVALATARLEDFLTHIGVPYYKGDNRLSGCCPVHGGDNPTAFHIFPEGDVSKGNWVCYTHQCHKGEFGSHFIGFVRGVLSHQNNRTVGWSEAYRYICQFLNVNPDDIKIDQSELDKVNFAKQYATLGKDKLYYIKRHQIRQRLIIPAEYYIKRGYSPKILNKFDIGLATQGMVGRVIVPVYNERLFFVGCLGRTTLNQCEECKLYHTGDCPTTIEEKRASAKWINSNGFARNQHLYNYWHAKEHIQRTGVAVMVEGPGDVWRLEEAGIHNAVAMFGVTLGAGQRRILESSGALTLVILTDNDKAGKISRETLNKECGKMFRLVFPKIERHDIGETPLEVVMDTIKPIVERLTV